MIKLTRKKIKLQEEANTKVGSRSAEKFFKPCKEFLFEKGMTFSAAACCMEMGALSNFQGLFAQPFPLWQHPSSN